MTYDAMFVDFTQHGQVIPLLWGMPASEFIDSNDPAQSIIDYNEFQSVSIPEFSGTRVQSYIQLWELKSNLIFIQRVLLIPEDCKVSFG